MEEQRIRDEENLNDFLKNVDVKRLFATVVSDRLPMWSVLVFYESEEIPEKTEKNTEAKKSIELSPDENNLYEKLRNWRWEKAKTEKIPSYMIVHNNSLKLIVKSRARTEEDLLEIKGIGEKIVNKYGAEILNILNTYFKNKPPF